MNFDYLLLRGRRTQKQKVSFIGMDVLPDGSGSHHTGYNEQPETAANRPTAEKVRTDTKALHPTG